jgi:phage terminase large subunit-like protein
MRPDRYSHIWEGDYEPQAVGAIWTMRDINEGREKEVPNDIGRILVAVDPAVSSHEHSDSHGIVVVASSASGQGYVLEDGSTRGTPERWARRAIAMHDHYEADGIVIEKNQGGDMCRHVINSVRPGINIIEVHATRGKHVRAEPISALYALGRIHHIGIFPELEAEMCQMTAAGYEGDGSPDRVDALVWGFTELFPKLVNRSNEVFRQQAMAEMDYDIMQYETSNYRGRQTVAIGE